MKAWLKKWLCGDILDDNVRLRAANRELTEELVAKGSVFFEDRRWLGVGRSRYGTVIDGKLVLLMEVEHDKIFTDLNRRVVSHA